MGYFINDFGIRLRTSLESYTLGVNVRQNTIVCLMVLPVLHLSFHSSSTGICTIIWVLLTYYSLLGVNTIDKYSWIGLSGCYMHFFFFFSYTFIYIPSVLQYISLTWIYCQYAMFISRLALIWFPSAILDCKKRKILKEDIFWFLT